MSFWGSRTETRPLDRTEVRYCPWCCCERTFRLVLRRRIHHLCRLVRWSNGRSYARICETCCRGHRLERRTVEQALRRGTTLRGSSGYGALRT